MRTREAAMILVLAAWPLAGCDEQNIFETIPEQVFHGTTQLWELGLEGFPSGFDIPTGTRFFVGPSSIGMSFGSFVLEGRDDGTLVFRPFATIAPGFTAVRVGLQDLGARPFSAVTEVPDGNYSLPNDSTGVAVVQGHTYAIRVSGSTPTGLIAINYGKLHVAEVGLQFPEDPRSRFARIEWAYQNQPQERNVTVVEGSP
jgi:hypothetical protein